MKDWVKSALLSALIVISIIASMCIISGLYRYGHACAKYDIEFESAKSYNEGLRIGYFEAMDAVIDCGVLTAIEESSDRIRELRTEYPKVPRLEDYIGR